MIQLFLILVYPNGFLLHTATGMRILKLRMLKELCSNWHVGKAFFKSQTQTRSFRVIGKYTNFALSAHACRMPTLEIKNIILPFLL